MNNSKNITVFLFKNGKYAYWSHLDAKSAYKMIDDYSCHIHNGHLHTPRSVMADVISTAKINLIKLSPNFSKYAVTIIEDLITPEEFIKMAC